MHFAISEILNSKAHLTDCDLSVRELFFSPDSWTPEFLALDAGGWAHHDLALVGFSMVTKLDPNENGISFDLDRAALDAAPRMESDSEPGFYQTLPPLVVGPFGGTTAPLMMWAAAQDDSANSAGPDAREGRADWIEKRFDRFTSWTGREVFGASGAIGQLEDFLVDADTRKITHMVIGRGIGKRDAVADIAAFRHAAKGDEEYVVTDLTEDALDASTPPETWTPGAKNLLSSALRSF